MVSNYCYQIFKILFNINHLFGRSKVVISIAIYFIHSFVHSHMVLSTAMYSNNILNFQESTTNTHTKNVWKLIVCTSCYIQWMKLFSKAYSYSYHHCISRIWMIKKVCSIQMKTPQDLIHLQIGLEIPLSF